MAGNWQAELAKAVDSHQLPVYWGGEARCPDDKCTDHVSTAAGFEHLVRKWVHFTVSGSKQVLSAHSLEIEASYRNTLLGSSRPIFFRRGILLKMIPLNTAAVD